MQVERPDRSIGAGKCEKTPSCCTPPREKSGAHLVVETATPSPQRDSPLDAQRPKVAIPAGNFFMGTDYAQRFPADGEGPVRRVSYSSFEIDMFPVTNRDFARFVAATGYRTEAETFGWSFVFWAHVPQDRFAELVEDTVAQTPWWCKVPGAKWCAPEGPGSEIVSRGDHPVVHVSWNDASAYAAWASKRLPTEAQWECAARGGLEQKLYPWGDELIVDGKHRCNIWQGQFPIEDTGEDGFVGTCPVNAFPPNAYGIYSTVGNVWEWCADWFGTSFPFGGTSHDPQGATTGRSKVLKGGSFLCHASYCNRYRVAARSSNTPDSSASNIGFRCCKGRA